jgi:hypothetical protein
LTDVEGIDICHDIIRFLAGKGFRVFPDELHQYAIGTKPRFDCICVWNCLDQLPNPREVLTRICELLANKGLLVVRFPNALFYRALHSQRAHRFSLHRICAPFACHNTVLGFTFRIGYSVKGICSLVDRHRLPLRVVRCTPAGPLRLGSTAALHGWAAAEERLYSVLRKAVFGVSFLREYAPWLDLTLTKVE